MLICSNCISSIRLWPLKAKAMNPSPLTTPKSLEILVHGCTGLCNKLGSLPSATGTTHRRVQKLTYEMAPISDTLAREFKLGSWDKTTEPHGNTKYHSTVVNGLDKHVASHNILKNEFNVDPSGLWWWLKSCMYDVPADRSMIGNNSNEYAILSPALFNRRSRKNSIF